jgi:outer membrane protein
MSVAIIRSNFVRKVAFLLCLGSFPLAAQQAATSLSLQPVPAQNSGQAGTPMSNAPEPKTLPQPTHVDYSKPAPLFPNPFARYIPRAVPSPAFTNAPKISQLMQNGKLLLSMNDAIAIALADNLDIVIARYNLPIADTDILLTKAGGSPRGVNSGVVSNTPGGGFGGISGSSGAGAGGTTAGAGGAGAGAGGIVATVSGAGPQPDSFDPNLSATFTVRQTRSLQNFGLLSGLSGSNLAEAHTAVGDITYSQGFSPGTALSLAFNNQRQSTNSPQTTFNPSITSNVNLTVRQHLLQGFGPRLNTRLIRQAKNNKKITEEGFRDQVISTVSQVETIYWDLVNAFEDFKVKERSLALAQKTLSDNQKQVEIGTLAPLDVVRAKSTVATAEQDLIVSRTNLQLQQLIIKNALTRDLPNDSPLMQADIIPTDTVQIPDQENLPSVQDMIKQALANRPDYRKLQINLKNSEISIQGANNGLLPSIDLVAFYLGSGLSGVPNRLNPVNAGAPQTGFGDAFGNLFNSTAPDKGITLNIIIPLGNRAAQATQIRSRLEYRQSQLNLKQVENQIAINVRNDAFTVEQNRARVAAAQQARDLAAQTLDAEQKKYNLGASTYLAVLQDERDLAAAESALVAAKTNYAKAHVQLDKNIAQTLERNNIKLDEAVTGHITSEPNVPGLMPNKTALQETAAPTQQPPK